jgi:hypothetical protein
MLAVAMDAGAQMPRRDRAGSPRERPNADATRNAPIVPTNPYSALERELPSLQLDLMLRPDQLDAWRIFSRNVRDMAEMGRSRRRHLMSLHEDGERPPTASTLFATLAQEERLESEAAADLKRYFDQLYSMLDDAQKRTLDRRVVQSQIEPLGR